MKKAVHHHYEADHLGRAVEITERIAHRRRLRNLAGRLKPIYSDNAQIGNAAQRGEGRCLGWYAQIFSTDEVFTKQGSTIVKYRRIAMISARLGENRPSRASFNFGRSFYPHQISVGVPKRSEMPLT